MTGRGRQGGVMNLQLGFYLALVVVLGLPLLARAADLPKVGGLAPDFSLPSQEGTTVQLSKLRGQWVVLYFYPKDMTPGCTLEAHNFAKDQPEYAARKAIVLGVSVDGIDSHKKFCTKENLNFKLLADTDKKVAEAYGSLNKFLVVKVAARHTFLIDPQGKIARVFTDVKPASHSQEVLAALDALGGKGLARGK
jgi:peroxiredoxin Q/BCP